MKWRWKGGNPWKTKRGEETWIETERERESEKGGWKRKYARGRHALRPWATCAALESALSPATFKFLSPPLPLSSAQAFSPSPRPAYPTVRLSETGYGYDVGERIFSTFVAVFPRFFGPLKHQDSRKVKYPTEVVTLTEFLRQGFDDDDTTTMIFLCARNGNDRHGAWWRGIRARCFEKIGRKFGSNEG